MKTHLTPGSMDPYSRAPRSPKSKNQSPRTPGLENMTQLYNTEECRSPGATSDQVGTGALPTDTDVRPVPDSLYMCLYTVVWNYVNPSRVMLRRKMQSQAPKLVITEVPFPLRFLWEKAVTHVKTLQNYVTLFPYNIPLFCLMISC